MNGNIAYNDSGSGSQKQFVTGENFILKNLCHFGHQCPSFFSESYKIRFRFSRTRRGSRHGTTIVACGISGGHRALCCRGTHTFLEWSAFRTTRVASALAFFNFRFNKNSALPFIATVLFCAGIMAAVHPLAADCLMAGKPETIVVNGKAPNRDVNWERFEAC